MKTLSKIYEARKNGELKKIYILTIMIPYEMWKEYNLYDKFFGSLDNEEAQRFEELDKILGKLDDGNKRVQFSAIQEFFIIIDKLCNYMLNDEKQNLDKADIRIWNEIKQYVIANN